VTQIKLSPVKDWAALGISWRRLEAEAPCSFFQSWTWIGCLAEERFPDPVLLEARDGGQIVALALFNRRRTRLGRQILFLHESGDPIRDGPFIEHNGLLHRAGVPDDLAASCLRAARWQALGRKHSLLPRRLVLSGVDGRLLAVARARPRRSMAAPFLALAKLRDAGRDVLDALSANTRHQVRRSMRAYAALGELALQRAATPAEAHAYLDELAVLHQQTWTARGKPGCFAQPFFARFHHALIDRGLARQEIDLFRVTAGETLVGVLYNFRHRGRSLAYQSGFAYGLGGRHAKPGLTSHVLAIRFCLEAGLDAYDFLAGEDRYKSSLSDSTVILHWL
jgi:CelD/BcsL family acetyltransferase involved in cellulose biosynthesis